MNTLAEEIETAVSRALHPVVAKLTRMEALWNELNLKRPSRATLAKRAGVSRTTEWRRRRKAELQKLVSL